jgi:DNA-binding transcriptional LysR family regulator
MALNIKYRAMKAFLLAAETGSFTAGAGILGVTQPSFSALVQDLENDLGLRLFERHTRSIKLTAGGIELHDRILRPLTDLEDVYRDMADLAAARRGIAVVGALPSTSLTLVPPTLAALGKRYPALKVRVIEAYNDELIEMLRTNKVEFALAARIDVLPEMTFEPLVNDNYCVVYPAGHAIGKLDKVTWADLAKHKLVLLAHGSSARQQFDRAVRLEETSSVLHYEVTHMATALAVVKQGLGIAVLPRLPLKALPMSDLRFMPIEGDTAHRRIGVLYRRERHLSPASRAFIELVKEVAATEPTSIEHVVGH